MSKFTKKGIIFQMMLLLFFEFQSRAQEPKGKPPDDTIYCAELEVEILGFESIHPTFIQICCGGLFQDGLYPCKLITKNTYAIFTGQSEGDFTIKNQRFPIYELVFETKRKKFSKLEQIEVVNSSIVFIKDGLKVAVKKGIYSLDQDQNIILEVEYLK